MSWSIALHGGAGVIPKTIAHDIKQTYIAGLSAALQIGEFILKNGGSAMDAVEATVIALEDNPRFNAGKGSVFTHDETHEMDASIMDGVTLHCGAVTGLRSRKNPIQIARRVMTDSSHILLSGEGAEAFADSIGFDVMPDDYFFDQYRWEQLQQAKASGQSVLDHSVFEDSDGIQKKGTVGAVARDVNGNLAAATSTGGMTNKRYGRIGDSPIIGAGTYANNSTCAISCTGDGEEFIRAAAAYDVHARMMYAGKSLHDAVHETIHDHLPKDSGGLIAIGADGTIVMEFNSAGMFRAATNSAHEHIVKIWD